MSRTNGTNPELVPEDEGDGLLFSWGIRRLRRWSLIFFFTISLAIHAFGFYLFRASTPPARNLPPLPATVMILSQEDPAARALIEGIESRLPGFRGSLASMTPSVEVRKYVAGFVPSFAGREPGFIDPVVRGELGAADLPLITGGFEASLPPVPSRSFTGDANAGAMRQVVPVRMVALGGLPAPLARDGADGKRDVWTPILKSSGVTTLRAFVVIGEQGNVVLALPVQDLSSELVAELGLAVGSLSFPAIEQASAGTRESDPRRSGWIEVSWDDGTTIQDGGGEE